LHYKNFYYLCAHKQQQKMQNIMATKPTTPATGNPLQAAPPKACRTTAAGSNDHLQQASAARTSSQQTTPPHPPDI
jgi:hypothetical protein